MSCIFLGWVGRSSSGIFVSLLCRYFKLLISLGTLWFLCFISDYSWPSFLVFLIWLSSSHFLCDRNLFLPELDIILLQASIHWFRLIIGMLSFHQYWQSRLFYKSYSVFFSNVHLSKVGTQYIQIFMYPVSTSQ